MKSIHNSAIILFYIIAMSMIFSCRSKRADNKISYGEKAVFPRYEKINFNTYEVSSEARLNDSSANEALSQVLEIAQAQNIFELSQPLKESGMNWYKSAKDPSAVLNINLQNGDITLNKGMAMYRDNASTKGLIKGDDAVRTARKYLQQLNFADQERYMVMAHAGGVNLGVHEQGGKDAVYEKFTTVRFNRVLDSIPVFGHSRMEIQLAEDGALHGLILQWAPLNPIKVDPSSLYKRDDLKKKLEQYILGENTGASGIEIQSIDLVYYDNGKGVIEPALRAKAKTIYPGVKDKQKTDTFPYDIVVPLLSTSRVIYPYMHNNTRKPVEIRPDDTRDTLQLKIGNDETNRNQ